MAGARDQLQVPSGFAWWISDPSCHLAEQRIVGVVEGEQEGGAMPAPAEGPAQGGAAEAIYDRLWGRIASLATGDAGKLPTLRLAAGLSGHEVEPAPSGKGRRRRSGRAAVALGRRIRRSAAGARVGRARGVGARRGDADA